MLKKLIIFAFALVLIIVPLFGNAETIEELRKKVSDIEEEVSGKDQTISSLKTKIANYQNIIDQKRLQSQNLANEIVIIEQEIRKTETQIKTTRTKIEKVQLEIEKVTTEIKEKERQITRQKEILGAYIREIYDYDQQGGLEIALAHDSFSEFLNQQEYLVTLEAKMQQTLNEIQSLKAQLETKKKELETKKQELEELKAKLERERKSLENQKRSKEELLIKTEQEEAKYEELLGRIDTQKRSILGDINALRKKKSELLAAIKRAQQKPKTNLSSTGWYFSQIDPRWAYTTIGWSGSYMADYGCAVTSVAMVFKHYGINIDPGTLAKQPIFWEDLIVWPRQWQFLSLVSSTAHAGVDWSRIDQEITAKHPVIVFVRANGRGAGHYVVIHGKDKTGNYIVHDPIWGPNIYLNTTQAYIGALYGTSTSVDQMIIYHPY